MQTPRSTRPAQPEIDFAGSPGVPASRTPSDPAVSAAFVAFHRNAALGKGAESAKGFISRGGLALAVLTLLGFGGGLSLAVFSFNSTEKSGTTVASRPAEIIYRAPAAVETPEQPDAAPLYDVSGEVGLFASSAFELRAEDEPIPETSVWRDISPRSGFQFNPSYSDGAAPVVAFAAEQGFGGQSLAEATSGGVTSDFGAFTAAPVPEPSTWASLISGAGLLLVVGKLKRRRS